MAVPVDIAIRNLRGLWLMVSNVYKYQEANTSFWIIY